MSDTKSKLDNGLRIPFRFYDAEKFQDRKKRWVKTEAFKLISRAVVLLPFQIRREPSPYPLFEVSVINAITGAVAVPDLLPYIPENDIEIIAFDGVDYIVYYGTADFLDGFKLPAGKYYVKVSDTINEWFSEVITVVDFSLASDSCFIEIVYCNCSPVDNILYGEYGYKNRLYLEADIGTPQYKTEEQGFEDGNGVFYATFQKHIKTYGVTIQAPEFITDALSILQMHDQIYITPQTGNQARIKDFTADVKWQEAGNVAEVAMQFRETVIIKGKCCLKPKELKDDYRLEGAVNVKVVTIFGDYEMLLDGYFDNDGNWHDFEVGDLLLRYDNHSMTTGFIYSYLGDHEYEPEAGYAVEGTCVYAERENEYYLWVDLPYILWSKKPFIKEKLFANTGGGISLTGTYTVKGVAFPNTVVRLYGRSNLMTSFPTSNPLYAPEGGFVDDTTFRTTGIVRTNHANFYNFKVRNTTFNQDFGFSDAK